MAPHREYSGSTLLFWSRGVADGGMNGPLGICPTAKCSSQHVCSRSACVRQRPSTSLYPAHFAPDAVSRMPYRGGGYADCSSSTKPLSTNGRSTCSNASVSATKPCHASATDLLRFVCGVVVVQVHAPDARGAQAHQPKAQIKPAVSHHSARRDGRFGICGEGLVEDAHGELLQSSTHRGDSRMSSCRMVRQACATAC